MKRSIGKNSRNLRIDNMFKINWINKEKEYNNHKLYIFRFVVFVNKCTGWFLSFEWRKMKKDEERWRKMKKDEERWRKMKKNEEKWRKMKDEEIIL